MAKPNTTATVRPRIEAALLAARTQFKPILKSGRNHFLKKDGKDYEYATYDDILRATEQPLADYDLVVIQSIDGEKMMVFTRIVQTSTGAAITDGGTPICVKNPGDPQGFAAGLGWAKRLGLSTILGIRTGGDDDAASGESALGF